jgi:hypothetical protein
MRHKKTNRQLNIERCDNLWSELVKILAGYKCEVCGIASPRLNSHHFYSRANKAIRYDPQNGFCLCPSHHVLSSSFSAHLTPADFVDWARQKRGEEWLKTLRIKANSNIKTIDYELMTSLLKKQIETLKNAKKL